MVWPRLHATGLILLSTPLFRQAPVEPLSMSVEGDGAAEASQALGWSAGVPSQLTSLSELGKPSD